MAWILIISIYFNGTTTLSNINNPKTLNDCQRVMAATKKHFGNSIVNRVCVEVKK